MKIHNKTLFASGHNVQRLMVPYSVVSSALLDILSKSRYFVVSPSTSPQSKASSTSVSGVDLHAMQMLHIVLNVYNGSVVKTKI